MVVTTNAFLSPTKSPLKSSFTFSAFSNNNLRLLASSKSTEVGNDLERPPITSKNNNNNGISEIDPNVYNVPVETAAELWTVSVSEKNFLERQAGIPFLDTKDKDYYVDDLSFIVSRKGGMGLELLELAGGRNDGYGLTIIENVSGNAQIAGIIPGDSIAGVELITTSSSRTSSTSSSSVIEEETQQSYECECRDFDTTIELLTSLPEQAEEIILKVKRIRRWPKINVVVEYPSVQVAKGASNKEQFQLFAGENLRRGLINRGIVLEDPQAPKCDFCGTKCSVKVDMGMQLLSPMSITEEKIMARNPKCRISCKTTVGHNMSEGDLRLKVNLNLWTDQDKRASAKDIVG